MTLRDVCTRYNLSPRRVVELAREVERNRANQPAPMSLAEAAECCGQHRWADWALDAWTLDAYCTNCPLLIERREHPEVMRAARAM